MKYEETKMIKLPKVKAPEAQHEETSTQLLPRQKLSNKIAKIEENLDKKLKEKEHIKNRVERWKYKQLRNSRVSPLKKPGMYPGSSRANP